MLGAFDFPGNVRQLENLCHWLTVMAPAQVIECKDMPPEVLVAVDAAAPELVAVHPVGEPAPIMLAAAALPVEFPRPPAHPAPAQTPVGWSASLAEPVAPAAAPSWESGLQAEAQTLLEAGRTDVWDVLTRRFETRLIQTALQNTRGRRIEAAHKLGIGRNTITRKIQELDLE